MAKANLTFQEALGETQDMARYLLLGNGFSVAWDKDIFSYKSLKENSKNLSADATKVFDALDTVDFEEVIRAFEYSHLVCKTFGIKNDFEKFADEVRENLISTIADNHPDTPAKITEDQFEACVRFLKNFSSIYTLNYDMLLYWVLMRDMFRENDVEPVLKKMADGFAYNEEEFLNWDGTRFDVHYLHGALHIFEQSSLVKLNWRKTNKPLKQQFVTLIQKQKKLPLFVAEGASEKKLKRIRQSGYLTRCLNSIQKIGAVKSSSALFTYGVSFHQNDAHILNCLARNNCDQIFVSIFGDVNDDRNKATMLQAQKIAALRPKRGRPATISFFNAETADVWG